MIQPSGDPNSKIMVIGEAPGREELQAGVPFVGASGRTLWGAFVRYGVDRAQCFVTNVVQSAPLARDGKPTKQQIRDEWDRLDDEMRSSQAEVIVLVGGIALSRVTGLTRGITSMRGYVLQPRDCLPALRRRFLQVGFYKTSRTGKYTKGDPKFAMKTVAEPAVLPPNCKFLIPVLHPAGIQRQAFMTMPALRKDLQRVAREVTGQLELIDEIEYKEELPFPSGPVLTVDIETPKEEHASWSIERIGVSNGKETVTVPWSLSAANEIKKIFESDTLIVLHNAGFDIPRIMRATGARMPKFFCTMHGAQLLRPDLSKGLEKVAPFDLDITPWKHLKDNRPAFYNAKDALAAAQIQLKQVWDLEHTGQTKVFDTMMRALPTLWAAENHGTKIHVEALAAWRQKLEERMDDVLLEWPFPDKDPGSSKQMASLLYGYFSLPVQREKHGGTTTDASAIKYLLYSQALNPEKRKVLELLLQYREIATDLNVWAKVDLDEEGRIHPRFLPADKEEKSSKSKETMDKGQGAATGRIQARDPNIMNPDRDARKIIIPDDGCVLVYIDWDAAEARIEAEAAEDDKLRQAIRDGLHTKNARALGVDKIRAKNFWYGTGRGAGARKLVTVFRASGFYDMTEAQCKEKQEALFREYPKWANWRQRLVAKARELGYVQNPFCRRRYFGKKSMATSMIGFYPQSTVADMLWRILSKIGGCRLLTPMHDAILFQIPVGPGKDFDFLRIQNAMISPFHEIRTNWWCPIDTKIGLPGESWGAMEERYENEKNTS